MQLRKAIPPIFSRRTATGIAVALFGAQLSGAAMGGTPLPLVEIPAGTLEYHSTDIRLKNGAPIAPERMTQRFERPLRIMKRQVSQAEYAECVRANACRALDKSARNAESPDHPVVGVSWQDATDYARWYSGVVGQHYRLPTYAEWMYAAGEAYKEELRMDLYDAQDPAQRWLAEYALETQRKLAEDTAPKPFGTFGANGAGVQDMGGNVWEWTDTCNVRHYLDKDGNVAMPPLESCGVRVVAGSHYSMITDFMRDPKSGACSVGIPPSNLGIRLVEAPDS